MKNIKIKWKINFTAYPEAQHKYDEWNRENPRKQTVPTTDGVHSGA